MKIKLPQTGEVNVRKNAPLYKPPKRMDCWGLERYKKKCLSAENFYLGKYGMNRKSRVLEGK